MRVRTEAQRERILEAAAAVFLEMGFERASMSEIASRVGGSKATLYGYFPSKEDLFAQVVYYKMGDVGAALEKLERRRDDDPADVLTDFGRDYLRSTHNAEAQALKRVIQGFVMQGEAGKEFWNNAQKLLQLIQEYLKSATKGGHLAVKDARLASMQLLALYEAEFSWLPPDARGSISVKQMDAAAGRAVQMFLAAYGLDQGVTSKRK